MTIPPLLHLFAILSLLLGIGSAAIIAVDEIRRPQKMAVMNLVWPLCALFGSVVWLWFYLRWSRQDTAPMAISVAKGTSHCGAGCALGDLLVEWSAVALPGIAAAFGYGSLFGERMVALWIPDYLVAFAIGIAFQYFAIVPMRHLTPGKGIREAVKADAASITAWQVGMYGAMAIGQWLIFRPLFGDTAPVASAEFWWLMQIAMLAGFATAYPVNWWLIRVGVKEAM